MLSSTALSWTLTAVFVVTGAAATGRLALAGPSPRVGRAGRAGRGEGRVAELSHLVMSTAMIVMLWLPATNPRSVGGAALLVVLVLLATPFLAALVRGGHAAVGDACHLLTASAMVWMVAAAPVLMSAGRMAGEMAVGPGAAVAVPGWAVAATVVVVALLLLVAGWWAARARRPVPAVVMGAPREVTREVTRTAALCHLLMSLGTAAMLLAML